MVLFDKGNHVLKIAEFHKEKKEWLFQLKNAGEFADRADALIALQKIKNDDEVVAAVGNALGTDKAWGIRATAADVLGQIGSPAASKQLLEALSANDAPWVRTRIVSAFGNFKDEKTISGKLDSIAREDKSFRARGSALQSLAKLKAPAAYATLNTAVTGDSPDGFLRNAALRNFGALGDDKAVPLLLDWSAPGKPIEARTAAINSLGRLQKDNQDITRQITAYLTEPHFPVRIAAIHALGERGDATAIPALEALLQSPDLSIEMVPMIKGQIARLKKTAAPGVGPPPANDDGEDGPEASSEKPSSDNRLEKLEHLIQEMNERLKSIESRLPPSKQ
jgi:aminopeptidase N